MSFVIQADRGCLGAWGVGVAVWKFGDVAAWGWVVCWVSDVCVERCGALG
jgi:hypothetical protein